MKKLHCLVMLSCLMLSVGCGSTEVNDNSSGGGDSSSNKPSQAPSPSSSVAPKEIGASATSFIERGFENDSVVPPQTATKSVEGEGYSEPFLFNAVFLTQDVENITFGKHLPANVKDATCKEIDSKREECEGTLTGKDGGLLKIKAIFQLDELTQARQRGSAEYQLRFESFAEKATKQCRDDFLVNGVMLCSLAFDFENQEKILKRTMQGTCRTDGASTLSMVAGGTSHAVGYDLRMKYSLEIPLDKPEATRQTLSVEGNVTIDGKIRSFDDLMQERLGKCR